MDSINEAIQIIAGGKTLGYYLAGFAFAGLAIIISLYHGVSKRDAASPHTPVEFSWKFFIWDNTKRVVTTLIVMFLLFRIFDLSNPTLMIGVGFCVSFALDKIILSMMAWSDKVFSFFSTDRSKFL